VPDVCVVGSDIVTNLFPGDSADRAVNQDIWVGGHRYLVVGVLQPLGKILGISRDNRVYIPFATYKKRFGIDFSGQAFSPSGVLVVFIQTQNAQQLENAEDQVRSIMRNRRGKIFNDDGDDGFALETQDVFLNLYSSATYEYLFSDNRRGRHLAGGGRYCSHEHHAGFSNRADQGNWHS
jgi:hypothetical protein